MLQLTNNLSTFFHMGGYAAFVWPAYFAMVTFFVVNLLLPARQMRKIKARVRSKY